MIKRYTTILMALILLSALFIPGVMAQENKKVIPDYSVKQLNDPNATYLSQEDLLEYEGLIYMLLELDGIVIENLDLSNVKKLDNENDLILAGKITYDVVSVDLKSAELELSEDFVSSSLQSQELKIYANFNKIDKTLKSESSAGKDQYYELNLENKLNVDGSSEYVLEEKFVVDGNISTFMNDVSAPVMTKSITSGSGNNLLAAPSGWVDLPSNPPSSSTFVYNDGKLSSLIAVGSVAVGIVAAFVTFIASAGLGTTIAVGIVIGVATYVATNMLPTGVSADFVYLDYYFTYFPRPFYNSSPAIGYAHPTSPVYGEVDRYYIVPPF